MARSRREIIEGTELHPEHAAPAGDPEGRGRLVIWVALAASAGILLLALFAPGCREGFRQDEVPLAAFPGPVDSVPQVRMAVRQRAAHVNIAVDGPFQLYDGRGAEIPGGGRARIGRTAATFSGGCLYLGALRVDPNDEKLSRLKIRPTRLGTLLVDDQSYPGDLELVGHKGTGTLSAVVHLNLEEYVCGVLAGEVPVESWHDEALKAQAVASRSYAFFCALKNAGDPWDFGATGREAQQYRAGISRNPRVNKAVNLTCGEVLTADHMVFPTYFHSSCGGRTLDATEIFTRLPIDPLKGAECPWCTRTPGNKYASWRKEFSLARIGASLAKAAETDPNLKVVRRMNGVRGLEVAARWPVGSADGRITRFRVRGPMSPGSAELPANDVRGALGWSELPSTNCRLIPIAGNRYVFEGRGSGHGVGLCQWGAQGQALAGRDYAQILSGYFPNSQLVKMSYARPGR